MPNKSKANNQTMGSKDLTNGSLDVPEPSLATLDHSSDAQIIQELLQYKPVTNSEKNVWAFWDKGFSNCPPWCQRNVISWVQRLGPSWTVRVLDNVEGSPNHISKFVDESFFPESFNQRRLDDPQPGAHISDLLRLPLLYLYGGVWLDVAFFLFRGLDGLCWDLLADPAQPYEMAGFRIAFNPERTALFNGFIAARKGNRCIKLWHDTFLQVWRGRNTTVGMHKDRLLQHLPRYEAPSIPGRKAPPFQYEQYVDYVTQIFCLERLRHLRDPKTAAAADGEGEGGAWDGPAYFKSHVLLYDCVQEVYWAQRITMWSGRKQFELLSTSTAPEGNERYEEAKQFVDGVLSMSSTTKFSRSLNNPGIEYLANIWNQPENEGADCKDGTFAAYLRWASVHFEPKRQLAPLEMPVCQEAILEGPVLEIAKE